MSEPKFDKPPVHINAQGVSYVRPQDILNSRAGQEAIRKTRELVERMGGVPFTLPGA